MCANLRHQLPSSKCLSASCSWSYRENSSRLLWVDRVPTPDPPPHRSAPDRCRAPPGPALRPPAGRGAGGAPQPAAPGSQRVSGAL